MKRHTLIVEIAIGALVLALGVWLALDHQRDPDPPPVPPIVSTPAAPVPVVAPPPVVVPPASQSMPALSVRGHSVLCLDDRCRLISGGTYNARTYHARPIKLDAIAKLAGCTLTLAGMLTCGHDAPVHVDITMAGGLAYLRAGDRLASVDWLSWDDERPTGPPALRWLPAFPDGIAQVAAGFRIGCVLTRAHAVWCWSEGGTPRKIAVPGTVAEIAVIDPFVMCARTETGEVWCSSGRPPEDAACDFSIKTADACGTPLDEDHIKDRFEPVALLAKPFFRVAVPAATRLVAPEYVLDTGDVELEHVFDRQASACTIGRDARVSCFRTCGGSMSSYRVTGIPAAREVRTDLELGYAVGVDGSLWTWEPPAARGCGAATVAAVHAPMPSVLQLGASLNHDPPNARYASTRCALTADGPRCWPIEHLAKPLPLAPFDPTAL